MSNENLRTVALKLSGSNTKYYLHVLSDSLILDEYEGDIFATLKASRIENKPNFLTFLARNKGDFVLDETDNRLKIKKLEGLFLVSGDVYITVIFHGTEETLNRSTNLQRRLPETEQ